jgi:hypothetical protein
MEFKMNNGYIMSRLDLSVLLLSAKKDRICSLALPKANEIDDLQMLSSAFRLARDGLLEVPVNEDVLDESKRDSAMRADDIHPSKEAMDFMEPLLSAQKVIMLVPYDKEMDQKFIYISDKGVTLVEADSHRQDRIIVTAIDKEDFEDWLRQSFDLEENIPGSEDASNEFIKAIDPEDIERENLKAVRKMDVMDLETWMDEASKSSGLTPVFAMSFMRGSDGVVTKYRMMLRGRFSEWCIECPAGDILSEDEGMEVWPAYEKMWANI